jgi:hypothetical protein
MKGFDAMKLDRRRKYFMILDCETATIPYDKVYTTEQKQKISIAKPLIYDLGYTIVDKKGHIYKKVNFLISEIFSVPAVFNTAYYKEKRPLYIDMLKGGAITLVTWETAMQEFTEDLKTVFAVGAYNAMFDFKKAIPFTELYMSMLYSDDYHEWLNMQKRICDDIAIGKKKDKNSTFNPDIFTFRNNNYPLFDVWGLACKYLLNCEEYKNFCKVNEYFSNSRRFYSTNAERCYKFITKENDFIEAHTALNDAEIESKIFWDIVKKAKNKIDMGIIYFPFRILGEVVV